jgi:hypothetical protein
MHHHCRDAPGDEAILCPAPHHRRRVACPAGRGTAHRLYYPGLIQLRYRHAEGRCCVHRRHLGPVRPLTGRATRVRGNAVTCTLGLAQGLMGMFSASEPTPVHSPWIARSPSLPPQRPGLRCVCAIAASSLRVRDVIAQLSRAAAGPPVMCSASRLGCSAAIASNQSSAQLNAVSSGQENSPMAAAMAQQQVTGGAEGGRRLVMSGHEDHRCRSGGVAGARTWRRRPPGPPR